MNKKYLSILFVVFCLTLALTACSSQSATQSAMPSGNPPTGTMPTGGTMAAAGAKATNVAATESATQAATDVATEAASETPAVTETPAATATEAVITFPATPVISFYCLKSPDENSVGVKRLVKGSEYTALGRDENTEYYLVQYSDSSSDTCWAWKNYITIEGNGYTLPVVTTATAK